jgi:hypothetical protein
VSHVTNLVDLVTELVKTNVILVNHQDISKTTSVNTIVKENTSKEMIVNVLQTTIVVVAKNVTPFVNLVMETPKPSVNTVLKVSSNFQTLMNVPLTAQITSSLIPTEESVPHVPTHVGNVQLLDKTNVPDVNSHTLYGKDNVSNHAHPTTMLTPPPVNLVTVPVWNVTVLKLTVVMLVSKETS